MGNLDKNSKQRFEDDNNGVDLVELFLKYLQYWSWFALCGFLSLVVAFFYIKSANKIYQTTAKIEIIDESQELGMTLDFESLLSGGTKINLDNEIAVLTSYRLLGQVVDTLGLDVDCTWESSFMENEVKGVPFVVGKDIPEEEISETLVYLITLKETYYNIVDPDGDVTKLPLTDSSANKLPFNIKLVDAIENLKEYLGVEYEVRIASKKSAVMSLQKRLVVEPTSTESEILFLSLEGLRPKITEVVLNTIIDKFNQDGIADRQLVSERTVKFIDERFSFLTKDLDSIELKKEKFKKDNGLANIQADASATLSKKEFTEGEVFNIETQISLVGFLKEELTKESKDNLLPSNIGIESGAINGLVDEYNKAVLKRNELLTTGAGENNSAIKVLDSQIENGHRNILSSVKVYQEQLENNQKQLRALENKVSGIYGLFPEKERMLREIERQQTLKESLYLLLLQKREEAAINYAVTAPSIKVVDYAITNDVPVAPKKIIIVMLALIVGMAIPFVIIYVIFFLDTKIHDRTDVEKLNPEIPVLAEIPFVEGDKMFNTVDDRSVLAESFRILSTNVDYMLGLKKKDDVGKVVFVTSTIKGEGKTFVAINTALAFASVNKKVLLVGADLRNPQLHKYFKVNKDLNKGLSAFLHDDSMKLEDCLSKQLGISDYLDVCFSGVVPPNAPQLLTGERFNEFVNVAKSKYDYIIFDLAPTLLVTDTLIVSRYADETVYLVRAGHTDKNLLSFSKDLNAKGKLQNLAYIVNNVGEKHSYRYGYGYSYNYSYSYNYGYGYGYGSDAGKSKKPWYKKIFGKR
ncbi:tyrosine protein kinase [Neptunitalea chrysea]|uniref:non-specific protein-tyrosine kinase n=1 Tax=Neptunitalea chrysea TaxID=1647581 RepID=A0A9W6EUN9_9FLAO|nr:tyrosine-protein kinase [Neptunitalea chrysea]GLB51562.1 tyrosine protein kinase [Neptunitalea chrysea]